MLETYTVMPVAENEKRRRGRFKNRLQPHDLLLSLSTSEKPQGFRAHRSGLQLCSN